MEQPEPGAARGGPALTARVRDAICELITGGAVEPGERLVVAGLAARLGVGQPAVREALARLTLEGLVVEGPAGRLHVVRLDEPYVRDVFLVRGGLEGLCVELAAPRLAAAELAELRALVQASGEALARGDPAAHARADAALHRVVSAAAQNRILLNELRALQPHIDLITRYSQRDSGEHLAASQREHLAIIAALERRDAPAARRAMEQHIRAAGRRIIGLIDL